MKRVRQLDALCKTACGSQCGRSTLRVSVRAALRELILPNQALYLRCVFALGLAIPGSQILPFFPPSAFSFIFLFNYFPLLNRPTRTPAGPRVPKKPLYYSHNKKQSLCIQRPLSLGPVAFLCLVSCPVPFREVDERTRFTHKKNNPPPKKTLKTWTTALVLFQEQDGE